MRVDLAAALAGTGLTLVEHDEWRTRGASTFTPRVVVRHATITPPSWSDEKTCRLLIDGYSGLPGPLCQIGLDRRGRVHILASGRANHAGAGGWAGLRGNSVALGVEAFNAGAAEPWSQAQLDAWDVLDTALLHHLDLDESRLCSHAEWAPTRKTDPPGISMQVIRARVGDMLNPPARPVPKEITMLIVDDPGPEPDNNRQWLCDTHTKRHIAAWDEFVGLRAVGVPHMEEDPATVDQRTAILAARTEVRQ